MKQDSYFQNLLMQHFDSSLQRFQLRMARQRKLQAILEDLYPRQQALDGEKKRLHEIKLREQKDVERIEGYSISSLFYCIVGQRNEKLTKERAEACKANMQYDMVASELENVQKDIARYEAELKTLEGSRQEYERLLAEKSASIKASSTLEAQQLMDMEKRLAWMNLQRQEIAEAQLAGAAALNTAHDIIAHLKYARKMHYRDTCIRGSSYFRKSMYESLKCAQKCAQYLPTQMRHFRNELMDLHLQFISDVGEFDPPGFYSYTTLGGFIITSKTLNFINAALERMQAIVNEAAGLQKTFDRLIQETDSKQMDLIAQRNALIEQFRIFQTED